jgi:hypothetical protein
MGKAAAIRVVPGRIRTVAWPVAAPDLALERPGASRTGRLPFASACCQGQPELRAGGQAPRTPPIAARANPVEIRPNRPRFCKRHRGRRLAPRQLQVVAVDLVAPMSQ